MVRVIAVALLGLIVSGCAGTQGFIVPESDKDPAGSFDGLYTAKVDHPGGRQEMDTNWYSRCNPQDFSTSFKVASSKVIWSWGNRKLEGFVNSDGKFRLEQALESESKGIGTMMSDGSITLILQGNASSDTMKGVMMYGVAQFNNKGCSYPMTFAKK